MTKDIKDYLHLYLNAPCRVTSSLPDIEDGQYIFSADLLLQSILDNIRVELHLRPLSDMTPQEKAEYKKIAAPSVAGKNILPDIPTGKMLQCFLNANSPFCVAWLLSKGFDIFNLIPEGLAIDRTALKQNA